ncbi:hypothetical protein ACMHYJ_05455 [Castellaniella hirudinis]|uniref:hypothetical protein n=1 Tax=Castellaniella hirudinis TaxID=1144617 RepID=UPI0039C3846F
MDIRKLALIPTAVLHLCDANDDPIYADAKKEKPVQVHLYGPGSKQFEAAETKNSRRVLESVTGRRGKKKNADQKEWRVDFLVAITDRFENLEYDKLEGDALARAVYGDATLRFIADQVHAFVHDAANFTKNSETN